VDPVINLWYWIEDRYLDFGEFNERLAGFPFMIAVLCIMVGAFLLIMILGGMCYRPGDHPIYQQ
jgi:hypothetical protein